MFASVRTLGASLCRASFLLFLIPAVAADAQRTIHVPADAATIQAGINAASNGDTVLVAPGTYYENLQFQPRTITVTSSDGPLKTIIDGQSKGAIATFQTQSNSVLNGFTLLHGGQTTIHASDMTGAVIIGGGDYIGYGTVSNNIFVQSNCQGVLVLDGTAHILNNTIQETLAPTNCYAGEGSAIEIEGIGDFLSGAVPTEVAGNIIQNNTQAGGNVNFPESSGGITVLGASGAAVLIHDNIIRNNRTQSAGGAISIEGGGPMQVFNNLIYGNYAARGGGALYAIQDSTQSYPLYVLFASNTLADNTVGGLSSGYYSTNGSQIGIRTYEAGSGLLFENNIVSGNSATPLVDCTAPPTSSYYKQHDLSIDHTLFFNAGSGGVFGQNCEDRRARNDNLTADPAFVNPGTGDYHLKPLSPAVDSGTNGVLANRPIVTMLGTLPKLPFTRDADGKPRIQDATGKGYGLIDRGAFEVSGVAVSPGTVVSLSLPNVIAYCAPVTLTAVLTSPGGTPTGTVQFIDDGVTLGSAPLDGSATATFKTLPTQSGFHEFRAVYAGDSIFSPGTSTVFAPYILAGTNCGVPVTLNLSSSSNPAAVNTYITFTANITSTSGTPAGAIVFADGSVTLGTVPIVNGSASFTTASLLRGTHTIQATYGATAGFAGATSSLVQVIHGLPSSTVLTATPTSAYAFSPVALRAVATIPGGGTPVGSALHILDNGAAVNNLSVASDGSVSTAAQLFAGAHALTAVYDGDTVADGSTSSPVSVRINPNPATSVLTLSTHATTSFQPVTATATVTSSTTTHIPNGTVTFLNAPTSVNSQISPSGIAAASFGLPAGTYQVRADYLPADSNFISFAATSQTLTVSKGPTTTSLTSLPSSTYQNRSVTITGTVNDATGRHLATGTVTLLIDRVATGTAPLAADDTVTFTLSTLSPGSHTVALSYSGDANFLPSASAGATITVLPSDFTLTTTDAITIPTEHHHTTTVDLSSLGDFSGPVYLSCGNLPAHATCTWAQPSLTLSKGGRASTTFVLDTSDVSEFKPEASLRLRSGNSRLMLAALLGPPLLFLLSRRSRRTGTLLALFLAAITAASITGCSGKYPDHTAPGTYNITVTGKAANAQHTRTVKFIVTQ